MTASERRAGAYGWATRLRLPKSRRALIAAGSAILVLVVVLTVVLVTRGASHTITGTLQLADADGLAQYQDGDTCSGSGGYSDIQGGAQVTIYDQDNHIAGTGRLGDGVMANGYCRFPFTVPNVSSANTYQVEIGSDDSRGMQRYSAADLSDAHYSVALSLGDSGPVPPRPPCPSQDDVTMSVTVGDTTPIDIEPDMEEVRWRMTEHNAASVRVNLTGGVHLTFANGESDDVGNDFPSFLLPGETHADTDDVVILEPKAWGKPVSITPTIESVESAVLCR